MSDEILPEMMQGVPFPTAIEAEHDPSPRLEWSDAPDGDGQVVAIKVGDHRWKLEHLTGPKEMAALHVFSDVGSFVDWVKRWATEPTTCQILADLPTDFAGDLGAEINTGEIVARLDPRAVNGDRVTCLLHFDPAFAAWAAASRRTALNQLELIAFLRGYGDAISGENVASTIMGTLSALRVSSSSSIESHVKPNGRVHLSGRSGEVEVSQELPGEIELLVPIYEDVRDASGSLRLYRFRVLLDVKAGPEHGGIKVSLSMPGLPLVFAAANRDLIKSVQRDLGGDFMVGAGVEKSMPFARRRAETSRE